VTRSVGRVSKVAAAACIVVAASLVGLELRSSPPGRAARRGPGPTPTAETPGRSSAVTGAFSQAMNAYETMFVVPAPADVERARSVEHASASLVRALEAAARQSAHALSGMHRAGSALAEEHFSGHALRQVDHELSVATRNEALSATVAAGVSKVDLVALHMTSPTEVSVHAVVTVWTRSLAPPRSAGGPPSITQTSNELDVHDVLTDTSGAWLVSGQTWSLVPGAGP